MNAFAVAISNLLTHSPEVSREQALLRRRNRHLHLGYYRDGDTGWYYGLDGKGFLQWEDPDTIPWPGGLNSAGAQPAHAPRKQRMSELKFADLWVAKGNPADVEGVKKLILAKAAELRREIKHRIKANAVDDLVLGKWVPIGMMAVVVLLIVAAGIVEVAQNFS